ncbi:FAD-dependent oxidoreductase [Proteiniclasticum sp. BAD-10]|uniref:FAD-dependent oxidoreductase n=1 Tax=Proteiniclasticum sediminis TaxID=2804028 RepID=A0A941CPA2_9CLOT|nr:FAD-dependent oxidoreductase [Proteiniclasticum sediminis]MBR0575164.1 FAD-dependent oxidoreductase [Proteiniclasticum sediminis]
MDYEVIIVGGGLSGLTAGALLAKRGLSVAVIDKSQHPGGSCGVFKRREVIFDQGAAMLYGFGEAGFNAHRFVFNCLEQPIAMIRHDELYAVNYEGQRVRFFRDLPAFMEELSRVFPSEKANIQRFYGAMEKLYTHIMVDNPTYSTADETDPWTGFKGLMKHPVSYARFLGYLNQSARSLLEQYFEGPEIFRFFDKLTSTYCYATVEESPAVLAAVMFVDNHVGGSYYPAGSTLFLPGKLEKVIEEHGGVMIPKHEVTAFLTEGKKITGVRLHTGEVLTARDYIYSGTSWNLFGKLLDPEVTTPKERDRILSQVPTYPSVVLYTVVDKRVIPEDTLPIEMLVGNPEKLDESEVTVYLLSIDDRSLCGEDEHTVTAIGPSFINWKRADQEGYQEQKKAEVQRLLEVLEKRFPGFTQAVRHAELATPRTIERYTLKNGGAVAGPKQMLGQHMFKRLHTRTTWENLFCCGESTVMGTGTPTVTGSGVSAANAVLKKRGLDPFVHDPDRKNVVHMVEKPFTKKRLYEEYPETLRPLLQKAMRCRFCEKPTCSTAWDIPGILRRTAVGNLKGAARLWKSHPAEESVLLAMEEHCIQALEGKDAVEIRAVIRMLEEGHHGE